MQMGVATSRERSSIHLRRDMKTLAVFGFLFAAYLSMPAEAIAQGQYEFCLESSDGGGGSTVTCTYQTMAQCQAARSPGEICIRNPLYGRK
jgi:hypothetical protein